MKKETKKITTKKELKAILYDMIDSIFNECKDRHNDFIHIDRVYDATEDVKKEISRLVF